MQATSKSGGMKHEIHMPTKTNNIKISRDYQLQSCSVLYRIPNKGQKTNDTLSAYLQEENITRNLIQRPGSDWSNPRDQILANFAF